MFHSILKLKLCRHACRRRDQIIPTCRYGKNMPTTPLVMITSFTYIINNTTFFFLSKHAIHFRVHYLLHDTCIKLLLCTDLKIVNILWGIWAASVAGYKVHFSRLHISRIQKHGGGVEPASLEPPKWNDTFYRGLWRAAIFSPGQPPASPLPVPSFWKLATPLSVAMVWWDAHIWISVMVCAMKISRRKQQQQLAWSKNLIFVVR